MMEIPETLEIPCRPKLNDVSCCLLLCNQPPLKKPANLKSTQFTFLQIPQIMPSFIEVVFVPPIVNSIGSLGRGWKPPVATSFKNMLIISGCWKILSSFPQGLPMWQACESD